MNKQRWIKPGLAVVVVTAVLALLPGASAAQAEPAEGEARPVPSLYTFVISSTNSGKCLEISEASRESGAPLVQEPCDGETHQQWSFLYVGDNRYVMLARHSFKCLEVSDESTEDGAAVVQAPCTGSPSQQWSFVYVGGNNNLAINRNSRKCLDVKSASTEDGAPVIQWTCHGGTNQQWRLGY